MRIFIFLFLFSSVSAQKEFANSTNAWVMYFGNHRLSERWGLHTEYQWRRADFFNDWQQSLLRLGVDYYAKNGSQLTGGYAFIRTYQYGEQPVANTFNEHRIWEQLILKSKAGRLDFQHRYRLEQRFLENWVKDASGDYNLDGFLFRQRVRYRLLVTMPISRKEMADKTLFISVYDEPFLGFGKGIGKNILDQNRLYLALGWRFNSNFNIQFGYLNQFIAKKDGIQAERNHTLQLGLTYNLDLRRKDE
ncbi:MAG: DUF2490 domain-containing protein [Cryomorphaceae bacterium]|nr:DUF2490 domain-containing protein [Cryomorphaceae bacterium]